MKRPDMTISEPVRVGCSQPREARWGHFQFPSLFRLPGGNLMVTVNDADDAVAAYGQPLQRFVSADEGRTWQAFRREAPGASPHASCAELFDGEHLILAASAPLDVAAAGVDLPAPVGKAFAYQEFLFHRVDQCPAPLRDYMTRLPAWRWTPAVPAWTPEQIHYDVAGHLCWTVGTERKIPRTWFEHAPIRHNGELLYVDYRTNCLADDGRVPGGFSCLLMVSRDNGHSFQKRSLVASGRVYEPMLADTADGELVCVIRGTDQEQRPMLITRSRDHGRTWEPPQPLFESGVFPALVRLENGLLLLAYGRPGVWVTASRDGGRTWAEPMKTMGAQTCGYTNLLPLRGGEALLVYSNFGATGPDGLPCKSIEVRRIEVR